LAISHRRTRWTLRERLQSCGERCCGVVRPCFFVYRELEIGETRQSFLGIENAQAGDDCAGRKRRDGKARKRRRAHACQAGAGVHDLPGEFAVLERGERCLARNGPFALECQWQRCAGNKIERVSRGPDQRFAPHQTPFRRSKRTLGEHHVEPSRIELF